MSNLDNEYLRQAEFCQTMAKRAGTLEKKSAWLRLAKKWLDLAVTDRASVTNETPAPLQQQSREFA